MSDAPLVSVVITTKNRIQLLSRAIDSVTGQTYGNIELIVVDDASTDGSPDYCKGRNIRCISILPQESRGGNYARNKGILAAKGKYVAFLDDDDYWLPEKIEKQVNLLEETGAGVCHCPRRDELVSPDGIVTYKDNWLSELFQGDLSRRILYQITIVTSASVIRRDLLLESGLFDENLGFWQEFDLSIRLAQLTPFVMVNEPLYVYRINFSDSARLTNKYYGWRKAVDYIHKKYASLYKVLSFKEKLKFHRLVASDGIGRAQASGLYRAFMFNRFKLKILQFIIGRG